MRQEEGLGAGRAAGAGGRGFANHRTRREAQRTQEGPTRKAQSQGLILTRDTLRSVQGKSTPGCCGNRGPPGVQAEACPAGQFALGSPTTPQPRGPDPQPSAGQAPSREPRVPRAPGPGLIGPAELPIGIRWGCLSGLALTFGCLPGGEHRQL